MATPLTTKTNKTCTIIARCTVRKTGRVFLIIENGGGKRYTVNIQPDGSMTCLQENGEDCPSRKGGHTCYHIKNAQAYEQKRAERLARKAQEQTEHEPRQEAQENTESAPLAVLDAQPVEPSYADVHGLTLPIEENLIVGDPRTPHLGYASNLARIQQAQREQRARRREEAPLNGNRGFHLMR